MGGLAGLSRSRLALLVAVLLVVHLSASGGQVFASYVLSEGANSIVFALLMVALATVLSAAVASLTDRPGLVCAVSVAKNQGHLVYVVLLGLNNAVKSVAFLLALWYVSALNAAVYIPLIPVFACVLARILGWEERMNWQQIGGVAVAIAGALLVTVAKYAAESSTTGAVKVLVGNGLLLTWDMTAAAAIVLQRPLLRHHTPITLATYVLACATVFLALVVPWVEPNAGDWSFSSLAQCAVVYCAAYNALMNWGDAWAVTLIPASLVAMWLTLEPVFTAAISAVALGDDMDAVEYAGSAMTCAGLVMVLSAIEDRQVANLPQVSSRDKLGQARARGDDEGAPLIAEGPA